MILRYSKGWVAYVLLSLAIIGGKLKLPSLDNRLELTLTLPSNNDNTLELLSLWDIPKPDLRDVEHGRGREVRVVIWRKERVWMSGGRGGGRRLRVTTM